MTLTQLGYIAAVAKWRNFGKAAKACFISQPTLSMQIQKLEEELEVILFDRSKKPVELTAIGQKVIEQTKVVLQEALRIEELIKSVKGEISGSFILGIIPTLAPYLLPLFLERFTTNYPSVKLIVEELQTHQIIHQLKEGNIDAGILVTPLHIQGIIERPMFNEPFLAYLSPNHPLLSLDKISDKDLSLNDIWLLNEGHCFRDQAIEVCKKIRGSNPKRKNLVFESGNLETLKRLVDQKFGYTMLPWLATMGIPASERKKKIRSFKVPVPIREVSIAHSRSFLKKSIIEVLQKEIVASLPKELKNSKTRERVIEIASFQ
ncbi:MAG: hydrogen peroxide-inducible genes activator [Nitrospinae bacterium]|nr:hydrogen peroxide-inducible genes activator [Nitrospinota bacterium]